MEAYYPHNRVFNDVVFEGRNKTYGAYYLRHLHHRNMVFAIFLSIGFLMLLVNVPNVIQWIKGFFPVPTFDEIEVTDVFLTPPPTQTLTPPLPPEMQQRRSIPREQIQYVEPAVEAEDEVFIEAIIPTNVDIANSNTGTSTAAGESAPAMVDSNQNLVMAGATGLDIDNKEPFLYAEQMPSFIGGQNALYLFLSKNTRYPPLARERGIEGKVIVQFVVTAEGEIENVRIVRGIGYGCDEEALRALTIMPKWIPGKHNGRNVPVKFTLPIVFDLN